MLHENKAGDETQVEQNEVPRDFPEPVVFADTLCGEVVCRLRPPRGLIEYIPLTGYKDFCARGDEWVTPRISIVAASDSSGQS